MGGFTSKTVNADILKQQHFSINLKCVMPMLGHAKAEFQIHQPDTILMIGDVDGMANELGILNLNSETPYSTIYYVFKRDKNEMAVYAKDRNTGQLITSDLQRGPHFELFTAAQIWLSNLFDIVDGFPKAVETELVNDEATIGDKKLTFIKSEELKFNYIEKGETLVGISQNRPASFSLLSFLNAFVEGGRIITDDELHKIPENLVFQPVNN